MSTAVQIDAYPALILVFGMEGCPACEAYLPKFRAVAGRHPRVPAYAAESNEQSAAADRFGVRVTPSTFLTSYGRVLLSFPGEGTVADLEKLFRHAEGLLDKADGLGGAGWRRW